jgi:hypothetical protein
MWKRLIYLAIIFCGLTSQGSKVVVNKWIVVSGCSLSVDGSTNINNFSCAITNYSNPDTILTARTPTLPVLLTGRLQLDIQKFDCHNPVMTADLRKTLKYKEFPHLTIRFLNMSKYPDASLSQDIKGTVVIELAGVSKPFQVNYKVVSASNSFLNLVGSRRVNFSDFGISPPRKLGGMIKTNNELDVEFNLRLKVINQ